MLFKRSTYRPENPLFPNRALKKLVIPLIIEQALAVTVGMVDTIMISSVGEAAVSGISLVDMINILLINIFAALATGGAGSYRRSLSARQDRERAKASASQLLFVTLMASLLLAVAALVFKRPILNVVFGRIEADVMENALTYLMYSALSYPFLALYNACAALFRSMGNSRISMLTSLLMNVINIVGNAILIFGFGMGVAGAAIATLVSRVVAAAVMLVLIARDTNLIYIDFKEKFAPNWAMIKKILYIGVPNGLKIAFFSLGKPCAQYRDNVWHNADYGKRCSEQSCFIWLYSGTGNGPVADYDCWTVRRRKGYEAGSLLHEAYFKVLARGGFRDKFVCHCLPTVDFTAIFAVDGNGAVCDCDYLDSQYVFGCVLAGVV